MVRKRITPDTSDRTRWSGSEPGTVHTVTAALGVLMMALVAASWPSRPAQADAIGPACIEDGDTLVIDGRRAYRRCRGGTPVMLFGIDAPELEQTCEARGQTWACGREAASALLRMTLKAEVTCVGDAVNRDGHLIAVCYANGMELNAMMVRLGLAVTDGTRYAREEGAARAARAGMWLGTFQRPADWRAAQ